MLEYFKDREGLININKTYNDKGIIIHNSCEDVLKNIRSESVDLVLTDPPYNIKYAKWDILKNIPNLSKELYRVLKPNGNILLFAGWSYVCNIVSQFDNRLVLNDWIIYDRIKGRGAKKRLVSTREDILWYVKSRDWVFNKEKAYSTIIKKTGGFGKKNGRATRALSNVWSDISPLVPWSKEKESHPTQKPLKLAERIVSVFSNTNSLVLDCFSGSGTFAFAALNLNRKFIAIEKDKSFYDMSVKRLF